MITADLVSDNVPAFVALLGETATQPLYLAEEVTAQKEVMAYEYDDLKQDGARLVTDLLHEAAFGKQTLGLPVVPYAVFCDGSEYLCHSILVSVVSFLL